VTAPPAPVAVLLVELARRGIELRAAGDRLRYRPRSAMTPDLADRLTAHRADLLAILTAADDAADRCPACDGAAPAATYTPEERRLLAGCPAATLAAVDAAKRAFAQVGGVTVEAVAPFKSAARDDAARLIRDARRDGNHGRAVALRDAWRERSAICTVDAGLLPAEAEKVALEELLGFRPFATERTDSLSKSRQ
jgi:hypothetical protein